jgi:hypothetical protein
MEYWNDGIMKKHIDRRFLPALRNNRKLSPPFGGGSPKEEEQGSYIPSVEKL